MSGFGRALQESKTKPGDSTNANNKLFTSLSKPPQDLLLDIYTFHPNCQQNPFGSDLFNYVQMVQATEFKII